MYSVRDSTMTPSEENDKPWNGKLHVARWRDVGKIQVDIEITLDMIGFKKVML